MSPVASITNVVQKVISPLESLILRSAPAPRLRQLFIIGLPRSGTTLVYQYLVHRLELAYFTHAVGRYSRIPCVVTAAQHLLHGGYESDFQSRYGRSRGAVSPREAGSFWSRYFDRDRYVVLEELERARVERLRRTVGAVETIYRGRPFVNKNVKHLLRVHALDAIFPRSCFLVVERETESVALSLLRARRELCENVSDWWSLRPPNYEQLKHLDPTGQIVGQVLSLAHKMKSDLAAIDQSRVFSVDYGDFCRNPEAVVDVVARTLDLAERRNDPRSSFDEIRHRPQDDLEHVLIEKLRREMNGKAG